MTTRRELRLEGTQQSPAAVVAASIDDGKKHLLLAASGSVAITKLPLIVSALRDHPNLSIRVILTEKAARILTGQSAEQPAVSALASLSNVDGIYLDEDEWSHPWVRDSNILHIELRRWAHLLAIVPMSANLLADVTGGFCHDLLTCVVRAWDTNCTIIAAPAMNQLTWEQPITAKQVSVLAEDWKWFDILSPQTATEASGDLEEEVMYDWTEIVSVIERQLVVIE
ncbi:unnamed protein product [Clonostachys byssicola]|uniref:Flavoprotein domain-containing protein n=1 Tax=Clonostachys byssicola TaxID=160290 RepID=A0A9N9U4B7_9HYPO|nr:unnamed protein product [Clonostachys byssicola]